MDQALEGFYSGRTVLVTGFTGETGSWLMQALLMLGADVVGFGMNRAERGRCWQVTDGGQNGDNQAGTAGGCDRNRTDADSGCGTGKSLFDLSGLAVRSEHDRTAPKQEGVPRFHAVTGSVQDLYLCRETFMKTEPEIVFHLAPGLHGAAGHAGNSRNTAFHHIPGLLEMEPGIPEDPVRTYEEAVLGIVHVLDCVRTTTTEFGGDTGRRCVRSFVYIAGNGTEHDRKPGRDAFRSPFHEPEADALSSPLSVSGTDALRSPFCDLDTDALCSSLEAVKTWRHCYFEGEGAAGVCAVTGGCGNPPALVKACLDAGMCHYNHPEEEGIVALPGGTVWSGQESFLQLRGKNPERIPAEMRAVLNGVLSV